MKAGQMQSQPAKGGVVRLWSSLQSKVQSVGATVRQYPSTVTVPVIVFAALAAIGVSVVIIASNSQEETTKRQASLDAAAAAELMKQVIHGMMQPIYSLALFVQARPHFSDLVQQFPSLTKSLLEQVDNLNSTSYVQLGPMAQITHVYPENINSVQSIGLDLLSDAFTVANLKQPADQRLTLIGPFVLYGEKKLAMIGTAIVFVPNVTRNETFGMPASVPRECPPVMGSLCYEEATSSKFWGIICSIIYFDSFVTGPSAALSGLRQKGYDYELVQRSKDLPPTPGITGPDGGNVTLLARSEGNLTADPVLATINVESVAFFTPFTLMVTTSSGWTPSWRTPLIATVVVVSAVISVLIFILLLYMRQHQLLLYALVPRSLVQSMFQGEAFDSIVKTQDLSKGGGQQMFDAGTPMEKLMDVLSQFVAGKSPPMQDVIALRATIMHGGGELFEPQNLRGQLELNKGLSDDVVDALVRQLQGRDPQATGWEPAAIVRHGSITSMPEDMSVDVRISAVLSLLMKSPSQLEYSGSIPDSSPSLSLGNITLGGKAYLKGSIISAASASLAVSAEDADRDGPSMFVLEQGGNGIPPGGQLQDKLVTPQPSPTDKVEQLLEASYGSWTFNSFELAEATNGHPLSVLFFFLLSRSGLMKDMKLNPAVVARLSLAIEEGYFANPYHNKTHAADVLQTMHTILVNSGMVVAAGQKGYCPPDTFLACLLAAAGHDLGHSGVTNDFLIHSEDQLSTLYSDRSPMESHHLARLWTLLRNSSLNILSHLPKEERSKIRKTVIDLVSATDMKSHFSMMSQFSVMHQLSGNNSPATIISSGRQTPGPPQGPDAAGVAPKHFTRGSFRGLPMDDAEQMLSLQIVLKCADLGHIAETTEVHCQWVSCLEEEFFAQGDRERSLGLPISPLFDRNKPGASKSQIGFYDFVVLPLFHNFSCAFPGAKPMVDLTLTTYKHWKSMAPAPDPST